MLRKVVKSMFSTFERIKELAKDRGITLGALEEKLGLSRNSIYTIKNKKPSAERLQLIADYFNVSTDYLLGRTDNPSIAGGESKPDDINRETGMLSVNKTWDYKNNTGFLPTKTKSSIREIPLDDEFVKFVDQLPPANEKI